MAVVVPVLLVFVPLLMMAVLQFLLPVMAPVLMEGLGQSPGRYGMFGGALGLGSVWFLVVNTAITPVFGPVRTLAIGLLIAALGLALILSGDWPVALLGAFLVGFGYATTTPAGSQILTDFTPRSTWSTLFSLRQSAVPVGGLIAGVAGAQLTSTYGWRWVTETGLVACLALALVFLVLPKRLNLHRPLSRFSLIALFRPSQLAEPFRVLRTTPGLTSLVAAGCGLSAVHGAVTSFFVLYLTTGQGLSLERAGALFGVLQTFGLLGRLVFGYVADRIGSPIPLLRIQAPMSAMCAVLMAVFSVEWPVYGQIVAAALIGLSVGTWNGLYLAEIAHLADPAAVGRATAGAAFFGFVTYMVVPPLMGLGVVHLGFRASYVAVSIAAISASLILILRRTPTRAGIAARSA
jgi:MFS family permease